MRKLLILVFLLTTISVTAQDEVPRVINWQRIYSWKHTETKAYVDTKSLRQATADGKNYKFGMIMFYRKNPTTIEVDGETLTVNVLAKYIAADCEIGKVGTVSDFYFNIDHLPVEEDQPLRTYDYSDSYKDITVVQKDDPLFTAICPTYV